MSAPRYVSPMKARLAAALPLEKGWIFEVKIDGIRAIAIKENQTVKLFSRKPRDITADYPGIAAELKKLSATDFILDGEIVALDEKGRSSFQLLQNRKRDEHIQSRIFYYAFDLLHLDGKDRAGIPLLQRKKLLKNLCAGQHDKLRFSEDLEGAPRKIWAHAQKLGLEGIIAKKQDSIYEPDRRSGAWLKVKTGAEQEFAIGGYTAPQGRRQFFGAILIGYYQRKKLIFASKVGTGFDDHSLQSLYARFSNIKQPTAPLIPACWTNSTSRN